MRGDIIIIDEHHHSAAATIVAHLLPVIPSQEGRYTVTVAGVSVTENERGCSIASSTKRIRAR